MVAPEVADNMVRFLVAAFDRLPDDVKAGWEEVAREYGDLPWRVTFEGDECVARIGDVIIGRTPAEPIRNWRPGRN